MSIEFGTRGIAELFLTGLRGVRGVGFSRLQFILEVNLAAVPKPPVRLAHLVADVAAGGGGGAQRPLGKARPKNGWFVATLEHAQKVLVWLEIDLSGEQVEALERLRAGGPLASRILALITRRLMDDWHTRYGYRPALLETFVEKPRFTGTCYKAANWQCLGDTKGRGKLDRLHRNAEPIKSVRVYPLVRDFRQRLCNG